MYNWILDFYTGFGNRVPRLVLRHIFLRKMDRFCKSNPTVMVIQEFYKQSFLPHRPRGWGEVRDFWGDFTNDITIVKHTERKMFKFIGKKTIFQCKSRDYSLTSWPDSVSSSTEKRNPLGPMRSRLRSPDPHVRKSPRVTPSSAGGITTSQRTIFLQE